MAHRRLIELMVASIRSIFVSYRRADSGGQTGRIYDRLVERYGSDHVFQDVDAIAAGDDFVDAVKSAIASSDVALVVIGPDWNAGGNGTTGPEGRLADPEDNVRLEVDAALSQPGLRVIPVLVRGAMMPSADQLPKSIRALVRLNALEVRDAAFDTDIERLVHEIGRLRGRLLKRSLLAAAVLGVVVAAAAVSVRLLPGDQGPQAMDPGSFNIAVAEFGAIDDEGKTVESDEAAALSASLAASLETTFAEMASVGGDGAELNIAVKPPAEIGRLDGSARDERAAAARQLAEDINADVVLYGVLSTGHGTTTVQPEFYVTERNLRGAEELTGQHELGDPIGVPSSISVANQQAELEIALQARTRALAEFAIGLFHYTFDDFETAASHFENAELSRDWDDDEGKEVLYIFLGNSAAKLGDFDAATDHYERSHNLNGEYARARLGMAEALFLRSGDDCNASNDDYDRDGLDEALNEYDAALNAAVQPALSDIPTKVAFGRGRILFCRNLADGTRDFAEAEADLRSVVLDYENGKVRLATVAAEAHALLGLIYLPPEGEPGSEDGFRRAAAEYEEAIALTRSDSRKATLYALLGEILARSGDGDAAAEAYVEAIALSTDEAERIKYERALQRIRPAGG